MNSIAIDFDNNTICIMKDTQESVEYIDEDAFTVKDLAEFMPKNKDYSSYHSFTWNFEAETVAFNQKCELSKGAMMCKESFIPELIIPVKGIGKKYEKFKKIIGLEDFTITQEEIRDIIVKGFLENMFDDKTKEDDNK